MSKRVKVSNLDCDLTTLSSSGVTSCTSGYNNGYIQTTNQPSYTTATVPQSSSTTISSNLNNVYGTYAYNTWEVNKTARMIDFIKYFTEKELEEYIDKMIERETNKEALTDIISEIVNCRHFSEDFLCKYFEYIKRGSFYNWHNADIVSGDYARLKLLFVSEE